MYQVKKIGSMYFVVYVYGDRHVFQADENGSVVIQDQVMSKGYKTQGGADKALIQIKKQAGY